jgi:hypothetical protein
MAEEVETLEIANARLKTRAELSPPTFIATKLPGLHF